MVSYRATRRISFFFRELAQVPGGVIGRQAASGRQSTQGVLALRLARHHVRARLRLARRRDEQVVALGLHGEVSSVASCTAHSVVNDVVVVEVGM